MGTLIFSSRTVNLCILYIPKDLEEMVKKNSKYIFANHLRTEKNLIKVAKRSISDESIPP